MSSDILKNLNPGITDLSPYEPGRSIDEVIDEFDLNEVVKLASNENPLGASPKALSVLTELKNDMHLYPDGNGTKLKKEIASHENVAIDNIIIGNGSNEILELLARLYLNDKSEVLFSKHSFLVYKIISNAMHATIVETKPKMSQGFGFMGTDLSELNKKITKKTRMIFIANPSNPTGTILSVKDLDDFIKTVPKRILIVIDEAYFEYSEYMGMTNCIILLKKYSNVVITRSFSKVHALAGIRIGYGLGSDKIISNLDKIRQPFNVNYVAQAMAVESLKDKKYIKSSLISNNDGMLYLKKELDKLDIKYLDSYTNFLTIYLGKNANDVFEKLLENGVILRPLDNYNLKSYLRVTIGTRQENISFIKSLKKIMSKINA